MRSGVLRTCDGIPGEESGGVPGAAPSSEAARTSERLGRCERPSVRTERIPCDRHVERGPDGLLGVSGWGGDAPSSVGRGGRSYRSRSLRAVDGRRCFGIRGERRRRGLHRASDASGRERSGSTSRTSGPSGKGLYPLPAQVAKYSARSGSSESRSGSPWSSTPAPMPTGTPPGRTGASPGGDPARLIELRDAGGLRLSDGREREFLDPNVRGGARLPGERHDPPRAPSPTNPRAARGQAGQLRAGRLLRGDGVPSAGKSGGQRAGDLPDADRGGAHL